MCFAFRPNTEQTIYKSVVKCNGHREKKGEFNPLLETRYGYPRACLENRQEQIKNEADREGCDQQKPISVMLVLGKW